MASPALNVALTLMHIVRIVAEGLFVPTPKERRRAARIERRRLRREGVAAA